jgi:hypothetical protein
MEFLEAVEPILKDENKIAVPEIFKCRLSMFCGSILV